VGMPACTITSQTAHGGVVMVGFPQVLIGMMPASAHRRHACLPHGDRHRFRMSEGRSFWAR